MRGKKKIIRLSKSCLSTLEKVSVKKVLDKEFLGMGPEVQKFEKELSRFFKRDVVCFNSGTAALHVALQSAEVGLKDEVLVPSLTYIASLQAISAAGAKPVICDIDDESLQISLDSVKKNITKKTKAIMPVHFSGSVGNIHQIYAFAKKKRLRVIEDAAHAFGSKYKNKKIGSIGDVTCFSFDGIKNITTGEGGCLVTKDTKIIKIAKDIRLLGVSNDTNNRYSGHRSWVSDVYRQGWRYHMSDINASIGRIQLKRFNYFSKKRKFLCKHYDKIFSKHPLIHTFNRDYNQEVPHIYVIRIKNLKKRSHLRSDLLINNIQTGIHYQPGYKYTKFKRSKKLFPNTEKIYKELLTLPLHPDLSVSDIKFICKKINEALENLQLFK